MRASTPDSGETLELGIIFPPNLEQGLAKGQVMLYLEGKTSRGRGPLNALPKNVPYRLSQADELILDQMEEIAGGETPAMLLLRIEVLGKLLPLLAGHEHLTLGKAEAITVLTQPAPLKVRAILGQAGEIVVELQPGQKLGQIIPSDRFWAYEGKTFQPLGLPAGCAVLLQGPLRIDRSRIPQFLSGDFPQLQQACIVESNFKIEDFQLQPACPRFRLALAGGLAHLKGGLEAVYGTKTLPLSGAPGEALWLADPGCATRYSTRNLSAENAAVARLRRAGFTGPHADGGFQLAGQSAVLKFFATDYQRLIREWNVTLEERLQQSTDKNLERIEPRFEIMPSGEQWFDLDVSFSTAAGEKFSAAEIQSLILSGQNHTRLKNGKMALIDVGAVEELQEVLLDCAPRQINQKYRLSNAQAGFLDEALRQQEGWQVRAPENWRGRVAQQRGEAKVAIPPLGHLESVLRPYQVRGVEWMYFLRQNGFGGILADEMGLGKTLQTLACFHSRSGSIRPEEKRPSLVVCPTSLIFNWAAEAARFTPGLRVLPLHGAGRQKLFDQVRAADIVVTSYSLVRRDLDLYREIEFDTVVLDEAQHIKNRQTQNAQAVKAIRAEHRLVLTGTPLENSVLDLWSIFDFLMPGYLGTAADFRERYELPIVNEKSVEAQTRLARRVRPFLLRRLKRDVAADLPAKIEQISFCELTEEQQAVYQQVLELSRREVLAAAGEQGAARSRMVVLNALLRLRQICCDLRLLKLENTTADKSSGKMDLFRELLEEIVDGGHRVLVFSQFVTMLTFISEHLKKEGLPFCYLDGSTVDRAGVVNEFQSKPEIPVFLISLKAGGVGLNLTGADTVIHFDPWWNPAVEEQATDRAHRIGQTRVVTSYKLITRGTVEEKILNLQLRKKEIIKATLGGEEELAAALSWDEIQELFSA